ncbi:MAG: enoyl-CoA hydratase, partial [Pseudomonadota bacterium]
VSPESLRQSKRQSYLDFHRDIGASVRDANRLLDAMVQQADYKEGIASFLEKRPPDWGRD